MGSRLEASLGPQIVTLNFHGGRRRHSQCLYVTERRVDQGIIYYLSGPIEENPMSNAITGGCLCGNIRYSVSQPIERIIACHCTHCQGLELSIRRRISGTAGFACAPKAPSTTSD